MEQGFFSELLNNSFHSEEKPNWDSSFPRLPGCRVGNFASPKPDYFIFFPSECEFNKPALTAHLQGFPVELGMWDLRMEQWEWALLWC